MEKKVSVIIPMYNAAKYIEKMLISILNQTYSNIEVIIVDDESADNSIELVEKCFYESNFFYQIIKQKNAGASAARNHGLEYASGEYVAFVDADDMLHNRYIETLVNTGESLNCDCILTSFTVFSDEATINLNENIEEEINEINVELATVDYALGLIRSNHWAILFRREFLILNNLKYPSHLMYGEDVYFSTTCLAYSSKTAFVDCNLYFYRNTKNSLMNSINQKTNLYVENSIEVKRSQEKLIKDKCPNYYDKYNDYAIPRVVWSILKTLSLNCNFKEYKIICDKIHAFDNMKKLKGFPNKKIELSSRIFLFSPRLFKLVISTTLRLNEGTS